MDAKVGGRELLGRDMEKQGFCCARKKRGGNKNGGNTALYGVCWRGMMTERIER
jgi:hypothetical protein